MGNSEFNNACFEVLEILKYVREEDLLKIPREEIQMLKNNANYENEFSYDPQKDIKEQKVLRLTKEIIAIYFYKYIATENQKEKIQAYHESNLKAIEQEKINYNYNRDDIFKNNVKYKLNNNTTQLVKYEKEKWYIKIFNNIKNILKKIINR